MSSVFAASSSSTPVPLDHVPHPFKNLPDPHPSHRSLGEVVASVNAVPRTTTTPHPSTTAPRPLHHCDTPPLNSLSPPPPRSPKHHRSPSPQAAKFKQHPMLRFKEPPKHGHSPITAPIAKQRSSSPSSYSSTTAHGHRHHHHPHRHHLHHNHHKPPPERRLWLFNLVKKDLVKKRQELFPKIAETRRSRQLYEQKMLSSVVILD